ncbi:hypothetical protein GRI43_13130 [Altererythrobacter luteolus]|uniref:SD-repeat containing protein B domain-containing protein n=1 Tax=Pontixanthobacter luteolus TaxID=295089 RepID=A0A6I4V351_9SPHN|nr:hypothetical protein [Pontixanthobacter luteolus]
MTRKPLARNVGTVCLGTVLLGLGCTPRNSDDDDAADKGLPFPEKPAPRTGPAPTAADIPRPQFGPLARKTIEAPPPSEEGGAVLARQSAQRATERKPKERLLATVSDHSLVITEKPAASNGHPPITSPAPASSPSLIAPPEPANEVAPSAGTETEAPFETEFVSLSTEQTEKFPAEQNAPLEDKVEIATSDRGGAAIDTETQSLTSEQTADAFPAPDFIPAADQEVEPAFGKKQHHALPHGLGNRDTAPDIAESAVQQTLPDGAPTETSKLVAQVAAKTPPSVETELEEPAALARADEAPAAPQPEEPEAPEPLDGPVFEQRGPALALADSGPSIPQEAADQAQTSGSRRTISARAAPQGPAEPSAAPSAAPAGISEQPGASVPSIASVLPSRRVPIPMVSVEAKVPDSSTVTPANDEGDRPDPQAELPPAASLVPSQRSQTSLGLFKPPASEPENPQAAKLGNDRQTAFTASAQPPVLSYQDELILEIQIKGIDARDTIFAFGTRDGVYLPLGTLARILDLAITVSDDGHYANGWALDENRTLSINIRQGTLELEGRSQPLPSGFAAAFDGEMFLRTDAFEQLLPLKIEADLRSQAILIETLQPFPFEERMAREEERRRLETRGVKRTSQEWPRSETPWLLASLPLADVEVRALSDSVFGPRIEGDLQLAGDLAFMTAQAYLSGDTKNGLTASLIELGRQDPDADLLGPLAATGFAVGDVATVSMPVGLRSVSGRGVTVTNTPQQAFSVFERIDLRGILPDGYEVELYRNEILVGSTRETVNGQYEFLQIPVDFGLNIFRLVFFGPQGQRSEQVRKISVGDGRLPPGKLVYRVGAVQKDTNVLGVRGPNYIAPADEGSWRATAEVSYGLSSGLTTVMSGAWYQTDTDDSRWTASAGVRTGLGGFALKADLAAADGGAMAFSGGIGGKLGGSAFTLSHAEYMGDFIDETRSTGGEFLRRSTELNFNTSLNLGNPVTGLTIPLSARARYLETASGRKQTNASLRASTRVPGFLVSNTLEYSHTSLPGIEAFSQLIGNFDLATATRSKVRGRVSVGYQVMPQPELVSAGLELDYAVDKDTAIRGTVSYAFQSGSTLVGLSAVRDFDKFTVALDGNYGFTDDTYSVGLRVGLSFGRDPLSGRLFVARPGLASSGGASLRAFRDVDGDGVFGPADHPLPDVDFIAFNQTGKTDDQGIARLSGLGAGRGVSLQVEGSSLPDITLAPALDGVEIVPRPGRIHKAEFPIIALSELEGTVSFDKNGKKRGVSGVRLRLRDESGKIVSYAKTEVDGYYFFERLKPGNYTISLDADQTAKLNLCTDQEYTLTVGYESDILTRDVDIRVCT